MYVCIAYNIIKVRYKILLIDNNFNQKINFKKVEVNSFSNMATKERKGMKKVKLTIVK